MTGTELVSETKTELVHWMQGADIDEDDNTDEMTYALAQRILGADTPEKVVEVDDVRPTRVLAGTTFTVTGIVWRRSTKTENGPGRYALMHCVDEDGVAFLSSCGATKVILQLRKFEHEGWLPATFTLSSQETAAGRTVLELVAPKGLF
jgi:hypothetical protein